MGRTRYVQTMPKLCTTCASVALAALMARPAAAQSAGDVQGNSPACPTGGIRYQPGEYACIPAYHGARRLVRCDTRTFGYDTTVGIWTYISDSCPSVMIINPAWPNDWSQMPTTADMSPIPVTVNLSAIAAEIAPRIGSVWR